MRKLLLIASALVLMLPVSLMADPIDFGSTGGTLVVSGSTLSTTAAGGVASVLNAVTGTSMSLNASNLGTLNFATGTLASGSLGAGGTFNAGGNITIASNNNSLWGSDANDPDVFFGAFSGPETWTALGNGTYALAGLVNGTYSPGFASLFGLSSTSAGGVFISSQVVMTDSGYAIKSVDVSLPEARTLSLLGFGLLGLIGFRRKLGLDLAA